MRDWCDILDHTDLQPHPLQGADCGLAPGSRALHHDIHPAQTVLHRLASCGFRRQLRCEWGALFRSLETV